MASLTFTAQTRLPDHPAYAVIGEAFGRAERKVHAAFKAGRKKNGDIAVSLYEPLGLSAKNLDHVIRAERAKVKGKAEAAKVRVASLEQAISAKTKDVADKEKRLRKLPERRESAEADLREGEKLLAQADALAGATRVSQVRKREKLRARGEAKVACARDVIAKTIVDRRKLKARLHQNKRRLARLEVFLRDARREAADPTLCFGSRALFRAQFALGENGYESHEQWRRDWRAARASQFCFEGDAAHASGNQFARLIERPDGLFDLELRVPPCAAHLAERSLRVSGHTLAIVDVKGLRFAHGAERIARALEQKRPVSVRFARDETSWRLFVTVDEDVPEAVPFDTSRGVIGIDQNADHIAATLVDRAGNPARIWRLDLPPQGASANLRRDALRKAALAIVRLASEYGVPIAAEKLDFAKKRAELEIETSPKRARMLSAFAYSAFSIGLDRACARAGVALLRVNPAYTSLIGRATLVSRFGLSVHASAAGSIARRAMRLSERLPTPVEKDCEFVLVVPLDNGDRVTLPAPARTQRRHVWSSWRRLARGWKAVRSARARACRQTRSPSSREASPPRAVADG